MGGVRVNYTFSPDVLALNPSLSAKPKAFKAPSAASKLEAKFDQLWRLIDAPALEAEYRFHPVRKWRFDRCHVAAKVAIELQGNGRHQRFVGYRQDREKVNEAQSLGWVVFELTGDQIGWPALEKIRDKIQERLCK